MKQIMQWLTAFVVLGALGFTLVAIDAPNDAADANAAVADANSDADSDKPRIAVIATYYAEQSHANVIATKFIEGFPLTTGEVIEPKVEVVSMWIDQSTPDDAGHKIAAKHDIPIYDSIDEALTLDGDELAVDGVLFIGEHGTYPDNRFGSKMYPRLRILDQIYRVFDKSNKSVPVYIDKMLSHNWHDAKWVVERGADLDVPLMAGSSLPMADRDPELAHPVGAEIEEAVAVGYGPIDSYGFHVLELLQCMVERRSGGETGVKSVRCVTGREVYELAEQGLFSMELAEAACRGMKRKEDGSIQENEDNPVAMVIEYEDGTRGTALMITDHIGESWGYAARMDDGSIVHSEFKLDKNKQRYSHFSYLGLNIQEMFLTGEPQTPIERTLLTSGMLDAGLRSRAHGSTARETPELEVQYQPLDVTIRRPRGEVEFQKQ